MSAPPQSTGTAGYGALWALTTVWVAALATVTLIIIFSHTDQTGVVIAVLSAAAGLTGSLLTLSQSAKNAEKIDQVRTAVNGNLEKTVKEAYEKGKKDAMGVGTNGE